MLKLVSDGGDNNDVVAVPEMEKKGTFDSPAVALANKVLPVPGGPHNRAPYGLRIEGGRGGWG